jgi:cytidine deaminase
MKNSTLTDELRQTLIQRALEVRQWAYVPYSHYPVGAALLADSGCIYEGVNVENAAFPAGTCAERAAVFTAVTQGERKFNAIAVVTANGGSPCGPCRQVLFEFSPDMIVLIADGQGNLVREVDLSALLPYGFGPENL